MNVALSGHEMQRWWVDWDRQRVKEKPLPTWQRVNTRVFHTGFGKLSPAKFGKGFSYDVLTECLPVCLIILLWKERVKWKMVI